MVFFLTFFFREFRWTFEVLVFTIELKFEFKIACEVGDWTYIGECLRQSDSKKPVK